MPEGEVPCWQWSQHNTAYAYPPILILQSTLTTAAAQLVQAYSKVSSSQEQYI